MIEVEIVGTGGQGSVVAADLLTDAAINAGLYAHTFSVYGPARRGGRVESFVRVSEEPLLLHSRVYQPDFLVIADENELALTAVKKGSTVIINTSKPKNTFTSLKDCKVYTIDAYQIASEKGLALPSGQTIINTTLLGAIAGLIPMVGIDHLVETLQETNKVPAREKNIEAAREAFRRIEQPVKAPTTAKAAATEVAPTVERPFLIIKTDVCNLCEICYIYCPDLAISLDSDGRFLTINKNFCKNCGICMHECPRHAIVWQGGAN